MPKPFRGHTIFPYLVQPEREVKGRVYAEEDSAWMTKFIVRKESSEGLHDGGFIVYKTPISFIRDIEHVSPLWRNFHEIVMGTQKPHFDIDIKHKEVKGSFTPEKLCNDTIQAIAMGIRRVMLELVTEPGFAGIKPEEILVHTSHGLTKSGEMKQSAHVILHGWMHRDHIEAQAFCKRVLSGMPEHLREWVDLNPYKSTQNWRMMGMTKMGEQRYKTPASWVWMDQDGPRLIEPPKAETTVEKRLMQLNALVGYTPHHKLIPSACTTTPYQWLKQDDEEFPDHVVEEVWDWFQQQPEASAFTYRTSTANAITLNRAQASFCPRCERIHENENARLVILPDGAVLFHCMRGRPRRIHQIDLHPEEEAESPMEAKMREKYGHLMEPKEPKEPKAKSEVPEIEDLDGWEEMVEAEIEEIPGFEQFEVDDPWRDGDESDAEDVEEVVDIDENVDGPEIKARPDPAILARAHKEKLLQMGEEITPVSIGKAVPDVKKEYAGKPRSRDIRKDNTRTKWDPTTLLFLPPKVTSTTQDVQQRELSKANSKNTREIPKTVPESLIPGSKKASAEKPKRRRMSGAQKPGRLKRSG